MARLQDRQMTAYVTTRYYRAPEVVIQHGRYDSKVDMFSLGCIFAELLEKRILFKSRDGKYVEHMFNFIFSIDYSPKARNHYIMITELLGKTPDEMQENVTNRFVSSYL